MVISPSSLYAQVECLGDLQGPKFRVGELAGDPIPLKDGDVLEFGICKVPWTGRMNHGAH